LVATGFGVRVEGWEFKVEGFETVTVLVVTEEGSGVKV
jgi:hypothetical protein